MPAGHAPNLTDVGRWRAVVHRVAVVLLVILATLLGLNAASYAEIRAPP